MLGINLQCIMKRQPIDINSTEWAEYRDFKPTIKYNYKLNKLQLNGLEKINNTSVSNERSQENDNTAENGPVSP